MEMERTKQPVPFLRTRTGNKGGSFVLDLEEKSRICLEKQTLKIEESANGLA